MGDPYHTVTDEAGVKALAAEEHTFTEHSFTQDELAAAFITWDTRYREDPSGFMSDVEHLLGNTPESYGEASAAYLLQLLQG